MSHCTIKEFLEGSNDLIVSLHGTRYGGEFIAIISHVNKVEDTIDTFECTNGESVWHLWSTADHWYPWGAGDSINEALNKLRKHLQHYRAQWAEIRFGVEQISQHAPHIVEQRLCKVLSMEQLIQARKEWNDVSGPAEFF